MYNFPGDEWIELPPMQRGHSLHGCGRGKKADGTINAVVVAGNSHDYSVEIYDFDTQSWR